MEFKYDIKSMFFDRKAVTDAVDKGTRSVLSRFGAFVRTAARSSIRKRKAISRPGEPPSSHVGLLKKLIYFGYDRSSKSVVVGPTPLNGRAIVPPLLEDGGTLSRKDTGKVQRCTYRARPFMKPALKKEQLRLPALWANSVK